MTVSRIALLTKMDLFQGLNESELDAVAKMAIPVTLEPDEYLFHQDEPARRLFVIAEGQLRLVQIDAEGEQVVIRFARTGETIAGVVVLGDVPYPISVQAVEKCSLLAFERKTMLALMQKHPPILLNALRHLALRVVELQERVREISTKRVGTRLALTLLRLAHQMGRVTDDGILIDMPLSRQDLAEMTGTTLYTASRFLSSWENEGILLGGRERVVIRSEADLERIAEE